VLPRPIELRRLLFRIHLPHLVGVRVGARVRVRVRVRVICRTCCQKMFDLPEARPYVAAASPRMDLVRVRVRVRVKG